MAGLLAGLVASGVMILISTLGGGLSLPEVVGSKLTALMPLSVFAYLHELIGADAKYYLFYVIFAGQCVVFALSGGLFNVVLNILEQHGRPQGSPSLRVYHGLLLAAVLWLLVGLALLPLTDAGIFGSQLNAGVVNSIWSLAVVDCGVLLPGVGRILVSR